MSYITSDRFQGLDLACVETQIGDGSAADCEILGLDKRSIEYRLKIY